MKAKEQEAFSQSSIRSKCIDRKEAQKVTETSNINDNGTNSSRGQFGHDKLHKVRPSVSLLNDPILRLRTFIILIIDEYIIAFKGRTSLNQRMPMTPIKRSHKVRYLAYCNIGYIQKFEIYRGKEICDDNTNILK
ncbi:piggyBac transposable element-derived protein 4 [Nephila pilipes]|uniref:PiggyBac transposable element-derived protein 4 n=1 Tax=Nephila pilipes TaxID=299642 RepID=A0A8X6QJW5_NEPPI|nr:piggyBac transposable element-derived protein 4 [Nephila pilipes]